MEENILDKAPIWELLYKDSKTIVLKMLKFLMEDIENDGKTAYKQNENTNKMIENIKTSQK